MARLLSTKRLLRLRTHAVFGPMAHRLLRIMSNVEVPSQVQIGADLVIHHQAAGLVIHRNTTLGDRVHLFQGVTIGVGRNKIWEPRPDSELGHLVIEDDVWVCTRATILGGEGELRVGRGTIVGANSVLRNSTGPWEIWAGVPARKVGVREPSIWTPTASIPVKDVAKEPEPFGDSGH